MKLACLNLLTAHVSFAASVIWFAIGQSLDGLIWLACSVVWLALALASLRSPIDEPHPVRRFCRRLSRMFLWS